MNFEVLRVRRDTPAFPHNLLQPNRPRRPFINKERLLQGCEPREEQGIPAELFFMGQILNSVLTSHLAIVGSPIVEREPALKECIRPFLARLFKLLQDTYPYAELSVVSGGTKGGEAEAQLIALSEGLPTVTVLPTKIAIPDWDHGNVMLHRIMLDIKTPGTAFVSEYSPKAPHELRYEDRNRIISWMSGILLVYGVDQLESHALHVATLAKKIDQPIFYLRDTVSPVVRVALTALGAVAVTHPQHIIDWLRHHPQR